MNLSGASIQFTAHHFDAVMAEGWHEHTWTVTGWWPMEPWRDGRAQAMSLQTVADALLIEREGKRRLPEAMWTNEAIAKAFLTLATLVRVDVGRPSPVVGMPGFHVELWR